MLQIDEDVDPAERTLVSLCKRIGRKPKQVRRYVRPFIQDHMQWFYEISNAILTRKKLSQEQYIDGLVEDCVSLDLLGILLVARMYHVHVVVLLEKGFWTTKPFQGIGNVSIHFVYTGAGQFLLTTRPPKNITPGVKPYCPALQLPPANSMESSSTPLDNATPVDKSTLVDGCTQVDNATPVVNASPVDGSTPLDKATPVVNASPVDGSTPLDNATPVDKSTLVDGCTPVDNATPIVNASPVDGSTPVDKATPINKGTPIPNGGKICPRRKPRNRGTQRTTSVCSSTGKRSTRNSSKQLLDTSVLDKVLSRKRLAAPAKGTLKEQDPVLDAMKNIDPSQVAELKQDNIKENKKKSAVVREDNFQTDDGQIKIQEYAIPKVKKNRRNFTCALDKCDYCTKSQAKLNHHYRDVHPDHKFSCSVCSRDFGTFNACYKHEQGHFQLPHKCETCDKRFQFPYLLKQHMGTHIDSLRFPCAVSGCGKKFANKDSEKQHRQTHYKEEQDFFCNQCDEGDRTNYATAASLRQHMQGKHGNGYISLCQKVFTWPIERNIHQKNCKDCQTEFEKHTNLAENPRKPKIRKTVDETGSVHRLTPVKQERDE